jgi:hypothetical protein
MSSSTSIHGNTSQKAHPNKVNGEIHDENKHLTEHNGKTKAHEQTNNTRRKSDAEKHAYADAHMKDHHPGIES